MQGKLIVLEGIDGSGKSTQFERLCLRLSEDGTDFHRIVFPRYSESSSALLRMYLDGEFGSDPMAVNAYAASTFYAVDRYASYNMDWKDSYKSGSLILCDRYTTANAIHQGSKQNDKPSFFRWLDEFEYNLLELPRPDLVLYLDTGLELALKHLEERAAATGIATDIHEGDRAYLEKCSLTGKSAAEFYGWSVIDCTDNGKMRGIEDIHEEIYKLVLICL